MDFVKFKDGILELEGLSHSSASSSLGGTTSLLLIYGILNGLDEAHTKMRFLTDPQHLVRYWATRS